MLVLSRQLDESIIIGDDIVVTVVDIRGDKVRLGIVAPNSIPVHRQEIFETIRRESRMAQESANSLKEANRSIPVAPFDKIPSVAR